MSFETKFSDSQPRDEHGRWTSGGGGSSQTTIAQHAQTTASTFGHLVGAAATATLAATVLAAALRRPQKLNLESFAKSAARVAGSPNLHKLSRELMHSSLGRALTEAEVKVVKQYTQGESSNLNKKLRAGTVGKFDNPHLIPQLDGLIQQAKLPHDMELYRGIRGKYVNQFTENSIVGDAAFQSTSLSKTVAEQFAAKDKNGMVVIIKAKAGAKALPIDGHSHFDTEHEVVLPRNSTYRVLHRGERTVHVELLH